MLILEITLYLFLLPWNHQPEVRLERTTFPDRQACMDYIHEHGLFERKKYLIKDDTTLLEKHTPGMTLREYSNYGLMRIGYFQCGLEPPTGLRWERLK